MQTITIENSVDSNKATQLRLRNTTFPLSISNSLSVSFTATYIDSLKFSMQHILASYTILYSPSHLLRLKVLLQCLLPKNCQTNCTCYRWRMLLLALPDCQTASLPVCQAHDVGEGGAGFFGSHHGGHAEQISDRRRV